MTGNPEQKGKIPAAFEEMRQYYDCLLGTVPGVVYTLDEEGLFTSLNDAAESALGFTEKDLLGLHFSNIIYPEDINSISRTFILPRFVGVPTGNECAPKLFDERRSWPRKTTDLTVRICPKPGFMEKEGKIIRCRVNASGVYGLNRFLGTVGVIYEMTEEDDTSCSLDKKKRYNAFELLVQALSHVFSNIFTGIYGNLQLIEMQMERPELFRENIEAIETSIENAATLIRKLSKTVAASESWDGVCLRNLLLDTADELLREAGLEYRCTIGPELWRTESDPDYIRHIFKAVYFHIARSVVPGESITIIASNVHESPLRLPRIDCAYIVVGFEMAAISEANQSQRINEGSSLEHIASMALSYELLKKIGGHLSVCTKDHHHTIELYLPALRAG